MQNNLSSLYDEHRRRVLNKLCSLFADQIYLERQTKSVVFHNFVKFKEDRGPFVT